MPELALETYKRSFHLLCPGPVNVHPEVAAALTAYELCHREEEFCALFDALQRNLLAAASLQDDPDYTAVILTGSGTCANETILSSFVPEDAHVLVLANGEFGERLAAISRLYHPNTHCIQHDWASALDLHRVEQHLREHPTTLIAMVHHETSSGMLNPIEAVGALAQRYNARFFVDAVSSFTADPLDLKAAHVDLMSSSSGKAIGSYPGLSVIIGRHDAFQASALHAPRSQYLNLYRYYDFAQRLRQTPNTPAVPLFLALNRALELVLDEGIAARHARFRSRNLSVRARLQALGLKPLLSPDNNSSTLTSVCLPPGSSFEPLRQALRAAGFIMYEGKGPLRNQIFQVSILGDLPDAVIDAFFDHLARALPPQPSLPSLPSSPPRLPLTPSLTPNP
jgi:2-aminoethylphosphonate-pyruvate transaminase